MKRSRLVACGACVVGLAACAGSASPTSAKTPASVGESSGQGDTASTAKESAPAEEQVRAADLPGEPDEAVGFAFGADPREAESACTRAGHAWKKLDDHTFHCDGLPDAPGMQGTVFVQTCGGQVCLLRVALNPSEPTEAGWLALYHHVLEALEERHGEPWQKQKKLPERCRGEELGHCLEKGEAALGATWQWPGGQKAELLMVPPARARSIAVRLTYSVAGSP